MTEKMSKEEFIQMNSLLKRYAITQMDQFELLKFDTSFSKIYAHISMEPPVEGTEDMYTDISNMLE